jgi:hypothetical protein
LQKKNNFDIETFYALMLDNIDEVTDNRMEALEEFEKDKRRDARAYNKKLEAKSFQPGNLVRKTILPIGTKSNKFGKWSPSWEHPYNIVKVCFGNSYMVATLQGQQLPMALNGRYLKKFHPSVTVDCSYGCVSSKVTSQVSMIWLVSRLRTRYALE